MTGPLPEDGEQAPDERLGDGQASADDRVERLRAYAAKAAEAAEIERAGLTGALVEWLGLDLAEVERIYGAVEPSPADSAPDDPSQALESVKRDRENPVTEADDMSDLERIHRQSRIDSDRQDTGLRRLLAVWAVAAASVMLVLGTGIFITYMISEWHHVPVEAIIAWLSASVLEVLGIVYVVANYLFPRDKNK